MSAPPMMYADPSQQQQPMPQVQYAPPPPQYAAGGIICEYYDTIYNTIRDAIFTCAQKLTYLYVSLIYRTEPKTKTWKTEKNIR